MTLNTLKTLLVASALMGSSSAYAGTEELEPLVGNYAIISPTQAAVARDQSIEEVVQQMNVIVRQIARGRLREGNPIPSELNIQRNGAEFMVSFDAVKRTATVDGASVSATSARGEPLQMTFHQQGATLAQRFVGNDGGRENLLRLQSDDRITVDVRVFSHRLPGDVTYSLEFQRQ